MMNQPQLGIQAQSDTYRTELDAAKKSVLSFLLNEGLNSHQAELAINQLLAGNPVKSAGGLAHPSAIHVPAKSAAQAQKVEHALSALSVALEPQLQTSLSIEHSPGSIAYAIVPWAGREEVEKALPNCKFAPRQQSASPSSALDLSVHASKTDSSPMSLAASREILRLDLHRTARTLMSSLNLYPLTTFTSEDERAWSEKLLSGGTVVLPVRNKSEHAKQFYGHLAAAALSDAQALRGVIASTSIEWREGKTPALIVRTGIAQ
ncbi:Uncharacterised protein [uncultured archaeon]|nr:Uncharacterised protein [uncultured archaeon]